MSKTKIQLIAGLLFFFVANLQSQSPARYFFVHTGTGSQSLDYNLANGQQEGGKGSSLNIGFVHMYNQSLGLQTGLGLESCSSSATMNFSTGTPAIDTDGDTYEFRTYYRNLKEKQRASFLDIPIGLFLRHSLGEKFGLMAMGGVKIAIPISSYYEVVSGQIETTGYYEQWNVEMRDMPRHGFATTNELFAEKFSLNPVFSVYADGGFFYKMSPKVDLYLGGFLNYGLNSVAKAEKKLLFQQNGVYNGVFSSDQVSKTRLICLGLKVGLYIQLGERRISCW